MCKRVCLNTVLHGEHSFMCAFTPNLTILILDPSSCVQNLLKC